MNLRWPSDALLEPPRTESSSICSYELSPSEIALKSIAIMQVSATDFMLKIGAARQGTG